jgi:ribosomal protein S15P/S13E
MERFPNIEKIFSKDRLRGGLDSFFLHIAQINDDNLRRNIVDSIMQKVEQDEYFSEDEFVLLIENLLNQANFQNKIDQILPEVGGKRELHGLLRKNFENYFRSSPEKKGINFRDRLDTQESVRAYLYLTLPENQRGPFQADFERLLTQKEDFLFRLWPPKISISFKDLLKEGEIRGDLWGPGEFFKEVKSYIEDLQKGKNRITLYFSEDLLPDELKGKKEDELEALGIKKAGDGNYEIYITQDKLQDILFNLVERSLSVAEQETEIGKKLTSIKELFKKARENLKSVPEGQTILASLASLIEGLENRYRTGLREGMSEEEARRLLETANKLEEHLNSIIEDSKDEQKRKGLIAKAKEWLKANGDTILSSIGLWGLAIGWFLPLWLISKMYDQIEQGGLIGKKK